jgi:hypothetical protein
MAKYAQPILFLFCRPCGDYHEKTHPHYRAQKQRAATFARSNCARRTAASSSSANGLAVLRFAIGGANSARVDPEPRHHADRAPAARRRAIASGQRPLSAYSTSVDSRIRQRFRAPTHGLVFFQTILDYMLERVN